MIAVNAQRNPCQVKTQSWQFENYQVSTPSQSHVSVYLWEEREGRRREGEAARARAVQEWKRKHRPPWGKQDMLCKGTALVSGNNKRDRMKMCLVTSAPLCLNIALSKVRPKSSSLNMERRCRLVFAVRNHCWASLESKTKSVRFQADFSLERFLNFLICLVFAYYLTCY